MASAIVLATGVAAFAHKGATGVVKERMGQMGMIAKSMKTIGGMMKGEAAYDAVVVRAEAAMIASHGGETLTKLFPEGSIKHPSEAIPTIWTEWERFEAIAMDLSRYATALSDGAGYQRGAAGGGLSSGGLTSSGSGDADLASMSPDDLFMKVAGTCSACHQDFRQKKE
ncbi:MAG: cytochrome c [Pseudomonadota bacterium]